MVGVTGTGGLLCRAVAVAGASVGGVGGVRGVTLRAGPKPPMAAGLDAGCGLRPVFLAPYDALSVVLLRVPALRAASGLCHCGDGG
ncbi:hypothetical protein GCM10017778_38350 [Streptomyces vinaceus]|nr:hypothetical protein GCM10017778_38350 [Streptomyces vinaceus]